MATPSRQIAAVDLGSNSFHMVVAHVEGGHLRVVDRLLDRVALAEGLDAEGRLDTAAEERALRCLARFGQRLRGLPPESVRTVGTNTFRQARDSGRFLTRAEKALGHAIEVVAGREEARLVYLGVAHSRADVRGRRLLVDIGGGSTESIVGRGFTPVRADSLYMGCVTWSARFFPEGRITAKAVERARVAALLELRPIRRIYRRLAWRTCLGSSGTILAVEEILRARDPSGRGITPAGGRALLEGAGAPPRVRRRASRRAPTRSGCASLRVGSPATRSRARISRRRPRRSARPASASPCRSAAADSRKLPSPG